MTKHVIIGGSAAGLSCAEALREIDKKAHITLISDENEALYSRCLLTYYIADKIDKNKLMFEHENFYKEHNIEALHGIKAEAIDRNKKEIKLQNGKKIQFDKLLIATGASPKKLGLSGEDKQGVFCLRTIEHAEGIISMLDKVATVVILGGGLIGLRDAYALKTRNKKVKVIVRSSQILSQMLDKEAADIIESRLNREGIEIIKGVQATEITGSNTIEGVKLDNGNSIPCQMVIIGKGIAPNIDIAKNAGIKAESGIIVDKYMQTSLKDVYSAGDVCQAQDITTGTLKVNAIWPVAIEQGRIAGLNMAGKKIAYEGSNMMNASDFFGLAAISIGITKPKESGYEELVSIDKKNNSYKKIILKNNIICGAILINKVENAGVYNILIRKKVDVLKIKGKLLETNFDYAKILPIVKDLNDKFSSEEFKETIITF